ncbi:hypothetical protein PMAYCL1PPCAC_03264, partial [Pristionchus mayeri]
RATMKSKRESELQITQALIEALKKYSITAEMTDERWEIIGRILAIFKDLDDNVMKNYKAELVETIGNITRNNRYDQDAVLRKDLTNFIKKSSCEIELRRIVVEWSKKREKI